jgi:hypothetical protein
MDNGVDFNAILEAQRRMAGQQPSGAGIQGGMPTANAPVPGNPIAQAGQAPQPTPIPGTQPGPTQGQVQSLNQAVPEQAGFIIKSLIKTLDKMIPEQSAPAPSLSPLGGGQ